MSRKAKRPSVSMTAAVHRSMAYAAEKSGLSMGRWVTNAIEEKLERDGMAPTGAPDGWEPARGKGGPRRATLQRQAEGKSYSGAMDL